MPPFCASANCKLIEPTNGERCLVNFYKPFLFKCHLLHGSLGTLELKKLKYWLGLKPTHIHSAANVLYLSPDFHVAFHQDRWFLLPQLAGLKEIHEYYADYLKTGTRPGCFTEIWDKEEWEYTFFFNPRGWGDIPFLREGIIYNYPYEDLPPIKSPLHPLLAIANAGVKIASLKVRDHELVDSPPASKRAKCRSQERERRVVQREHVLDVGERLRLLEHLPYLE